MEDKQLKNILEASLLVAGRAMSVSQLEALFQDDENKPDKKMIREALQTLQSEYEGRGIELVEIASGYRLQSHNAMSQWVSKLFQERTPRYSRALLETLVLIAYRQPITRAEIEEVRGVAVSSNIVKTLQERSWVKVIGHKDVPGRPALLGTTKEFLDYFNLKRLDDLPTLTEIKDLDQFDAILAEEMGVADGSGEAANDDASGEADENGQADVNDEALGANESTGAEEQAEDTTSEPGSDDTAVPESLLENASIEDVAIEIGNENVAEDASAGIATDNGDEGSLPAQSVPADSSSNSDDGNDPSAAQSGAVAGVLLLDEESEPQLSGDEGHQEDQDTDDVDADSTQTEFSNAEHQLYKVIAEFAEEHREEIDARDDLEQRHLSSGSLSDSAQIADGSTITEVVSHEQGLENESDLSGFTGVDEHANRDGSKSSEEPQGSDDSANTNEVGSDDELLSEEELERSQELAADLSQRFTADELKPGDLPEPGDTLH